MRAFGLVVLCAAALAACEEDEPKFVLGDGGYSPPPDTGRPAPPDAGDNGNRGPVVALKNLTSVTDPLQGPVLLGGSLDIECEVKERARGTAVDVSSVKVQLLDATGATLDEAPLASQGVDTFKGSVSLAKVPTGAVRVRCTAKDTTTPAAISNWNEVSTFYDAGPTITFEGLDEMSIVPRGDDAKDDPEFTIKFKVDPAPLAASDSAAEVSSVTFKLRDEEKQAVKTETGWKFDVDFESLVGAGTAIDELKIEVTATNKRMPTPATANKVLVVRVDSNPPTIAVLSPATNTIVGGRVKVMVRVTDDLSGVSANKALTYATLGDEPKYTVALERVLGMQDTYMFDFDASKFPGVSDIPINMTAADNVGNQAVKGLTVRFDTVPPWVSLASPYVRDCSGTPIACSGRFKALGDSPQDGATVGASTLFRTVVIERGIIVEDGKQVWISGIKEGSVFLYAQAANASNPMIVDNDGDGTCDALDIDLSVGAVPRELLPVGAQGNRPPSSDTEKLLPPAITDEFQPLTGGQAPPKCGSDLQFAITQPTLARPTAVYADDPSGDHCGGVSFNLGSGSGWICVVAAATDNSGNLGISEPIRVCRKGGTETCEGPMPDNLKCTKDCTMPSVSTVNLLEGGLLVY